MNEIEKALEKLNIEEKKDLICLLDLLISTQETREHQDGSAE